MVHSPFRYYPSEDPCPAEPFKISRVRGLRLGGTLNQPSGTITERLAKAKADPKLFVNREIFNQFSAAREAEFEEKLAKLRASSR